MKLTHKLTMDVLDNVHPCVLPCGWVYVCACVRMGVRVITDHLLTLAVARCGQCLVGLNVTL